MLGSSQLLTAAHACQQALPFENAPVTDVAPMPADCIGMGMDTVPANDESSSPLCHVHCEHAAQLQQTAVPDLPPVGLIALFVVFQPDARGNMRPGVIDPHPFLSLTEGSPPLRIQYQVFRI